MWNSLGRRINGKSWKRACQTAGSMGGSAPRHAGVQINEKENHMNTRLKQYWVVVVTLLGMLGSSVWASNTATQDATITVTPVANVSMSLSNATWAIGNQNVNTSTVSVTPM